MQFVDKKLIWLIKINRATLQVLNIATAEREYLSLSIYIDTHL